MPKAVLQETAMLIALSISQWTARKFDKKVTAAVDVANDSKNAGRFNKLLVAKEVLEDINKIASAARAYHYKVTLAWSDNGDRLLPAALFMDYRDCVSEHKNQFENAVMRLVRDYPALKADAHKRLGKMYDPLDYPPVEQIRKRFDMATFITPIPTEHDFRVQLSEGVATEIRRELSEALTSRQEQTLKECWARLRERIEHMHTKLSDEKGIFRDSLIENTRELIDVLPALNITNDPDLARMADEVSKLLVDPGRLRSDKGLRAAKAQEVADILSRMPKVN